MKTRATELIGVADIEVGERMRTAGGEAVASLARSMQDIGLRTPITVRVVEDVTIRGEEWANAYFLVTGATRLAAAKQLGWEKIECFVAADCDEVDAQLWEIAENLHRAELTVLERDEQVAKWIELNDQRLSSQLAKKLGRPEGGVNAAARDLGIGKDDAYRATKVASISERAKAAAREAGLDDNRSALLKIAKAPAEQQPEVVRRITEAKLAKEPLTDFEAKEKQVAKLMDAWNAASAEAREEFLARIDQPVMDRRFG